MTIRNYKRTANQRLRQANYDPRYLAGIYMGVTVLVNFLIVCANYFISTKIDGTQGLSQLGDRAVLSTVQSVLSMAGMVILPFWQVGFTRAGLCWAKESDATPSDLLEGFRRWGAVLRLFLLQAGLVFALVIACSQVSTILFSFTPFFDRFTDAAQPIIDAATLAGDAMLSEEALMDLLPYLIPLYAIMFLLLVGLGVPLFYRFRLAQTAIMDDTKGAFAAIFASSRMMKGNRFFLFRMDLSFWWYYALQMLFTLLANSDVILNALNISLPVSDTVLYFAPYGLSLLLQLVLAWFCASRVQTTYACFYYSVKPRLNPEGEPEIIN